MSKSNSLVPNPRVMSLAAALKTLPKDDAAQVLAVLVIGTLNGLKNGIISIKNAERIVFNLNILILAQSLGHEQLSEVLTWAMELEDIQNLLGNKDLENEINTILDTQSELKKIFMADIP